MRIAAAGVAAAPGFTTRYGVKTLVWYEAFDSRDEAFRRERQLKVWRRAWRIELIEKTNPGPRLREDDGGGELQGNRKFTVNTVESPCFGAGARPRRAGLPSLLNAKLVTDRGTP